MNRYLSSTKRMIGTHGIDLIYRSVTTGAYNVELGKPTNTSVEYLTRMYPKHLSASAYNYPTLVGKEAYIFYIANDTLPFSPSLNDEIVYQNTTYRVNTYDEHFALGSIVLYRVVAVRG
jgi:hypothetical protein